MFINSKRQYGMLPYLHHSYPRVRISNLSLKPPHSPVDTCKAPPIFVFKFITHLLQQISTQLDNTKTVNMSQAQPQRPAEEYQDPIKYGDVFDVSGDLASKPIAPRDAATMQAAENMLLGQTPRGGPAAVMQSAANINERTGLVGHSDVTDVARDQGVTVTETVVDDQRVILESIGGQVKFAKNIFLLIQREITLRITTVSAHFEYKLS